MISSVAETYDFHPQTLRLYEREGAAEAVTYRGHYLALHRMHTGSGWN